MAEDPTQGQTLALKLTGLFQRLKVFDKFVVAGFSVISIAVLLFLSQLPYRSADVLIRIKTESITFRTTNSDILPSIMARSAKVRFICGENSMPVEATAHSENSPFNIEPIRMAKKRHISLSVERNVARISVSKDEANAAPNVCSSQSILQTEAKFSLHDEYGQENQAPLGEKLLLSDEFDILLGREYEIGKWQQVKVEGNIGFEANVDEFHGIGPASAIIDGEYYYPEFRGQTSQLFRGQQIRLDLSEGVISNIEVHDGEVEVLISGVAKKLSSISSGKERSLLPTWLDRVRNSIALTIIAFILGFLGLVISLKTLD